MENKQISNWKCRRCDEMVNMETFKCSCVTSPSPWEPIIQNNMENKQSIDNTVELIGYYGDDQTHACSAWTSTNRNITKDKHDRIPELLNMLAKAGHHTPFEKSSLHFLVDCDIASHIHLLKHRIGVSINGESARYKELNNDKYYLPKDWISINNSCSNPNYDLYENWMMVLENYTQDGNKLYHECIKDIEPILGRKRAKESARFFKTYNSKIQADIMFNWRSFYHFQSLRNKPDAQLEIKDIAQKMLDLVKNIDGNPFKHTITAFKL